VVSLPNRTAYAVLAGQGLSRIETLDVPDLIISPTKKQRIVTETMVGSGVHKLSADVEREIQSRFQSFMNKSRQTALAPAKPFDPMAPIYDPYAGEAAEL